MIILEDSSPFKFRLFLGDIKKTTGCKIGKLSGDESAVTLSIDGELVAIGSMPVPIPTGDIEGAASNAYNWPNALEEVKDHKGHLIVQLCKGATMP